MTRAEFFEVMRELNIAYTDRRFPLTDEILTIWYKYLGDYDCRIVHKAAKSLVITSQYPPSIAEILVEYRRIEKKAKREMAKIDKIYRTIVAKYPGATLKVEEKALYDEIVRWRIGKAVALQRAVENAVIEHEYTGEDMPPLGEFLERFVE